MVINVGVIKQIPDQADTYKAIVILTTDRVLPNPALQFDDPKVYNQIYGAFGIGPEYIFVQIILTGLVEKLPAWEYSFMVKLAKKGSKLDIIRGPQGPKGDAGPPGVRGPRGDTGPSGPPASFGIDVEAVVGGQHVVGFQGRPVTATAPADGQVYVWNSRAGEWTPGSRGITPGGDLADWSPVPDPAKQRVIGLNTYPLPLTPPENGDIIQAQSPLMLSDYASDMSSDGTNIWVADFTYPGGPQSVFLDTPPGGIVKMPMSGEVFTQRFDYARGGLGGLVNISMFSVVLLEGYLYATGYANEGMESPTIPMIFQIDPANGAILMEDILDSIGHLHVANNKLWLTVPNPGTLFEPVLAVVSTVDLTRTTLHTPSTPGGFAGFAYDSESNKVWFSYESDNYVGRYDAGTETEDFNVSITFPNALAFGNGRVWVDAGSYYYYGYPRGGYPYASQLLGLDPADGSVLTTFFDPNFSQTSFLLAYDSPNSSVWMICFQYALRIDVSNPGAPVSAGVVSLDTTVNRAILVDSGFTWVLDNAASGTGLKTLLKIDKNEEQPVGGQIPMPPWPGIVARITRGPVAYVFAKVDPLPVNHLPDGPFTSVSIPSDERLSIMRSYQTAVLPSSPSDGERHTLVDAAGYCGGGQYFEIDGTAAGGYGQTWYVYNQYGSVTVAWSADLSMWFEV